MSARRLSPSELGRLPEAELRPLLERCCGARAFVGAMAEALAAGPPAGVGGVLAMAEAAFDRFETSDWLEAFAHHPRIGDVRGLEQRYAATADLSRQEQGGAVAAAHRDTLEALLRGNLEYERRFGFIFIVCAAGKSASEMLELLRARLGHQRSEELRIAAGEQRKITRLRLLAAVGEPAPPAAGARG